MNEVKFDNNDFQTKVLDLSADLAKYTVMAVQECFPDIDKEIAENIGICGIGDVT